MKNKKQSSHTLHGIRGPGGSLLLLLIAFAVPAAFGILLAALWFATYYTPFGLTGILLLLFPVSALPLFLPRKAKTDLASLEETDGSAALADEEEAGKRDGQGRTCHPDRRSILIRGIAAVLLFACVIAAFLLLLTRKTSLGRVGWPTAVLMAVIFSVLIASDRLLKNFSARTPGDAALISSSRSYTAAGRVAVAACALSEIAKLLFSLDIQKIAVIIISCIFFYCAAFFAVSFAARAIRKELAAGPDLTVPVPLSGSSDIGVIGYLEKNTGISMRSLFSIRLVKRILPFALVLSLAFLWAATGLVEIAPSEKGAVYRFGRLRKDFLEPGLHLTLPYPIDRVEKYETEAVKSITVGYISTTPSDVIWTQLHGGEEFKHLLGDGNQLVSVNLRIEYKISDLADYIRFGPSPDSFLSGTAYELMTSTLVTSDLETLLSVDRSDFSNSFFSMLKERLESDDGTPGTGLELISVVLESIHPPIEVAGKYQELISAGIKAEQYMLEAEGYASRVIAEAETAKSTAVNTATAEKFSKTAAAEAAVSEFMASVEADSKYGDAYRALKFNTALTGAYSTTKLIILGEGIDSSRIWYGGIPAGLSN